MYERPGGFQAPLSQADMMRLSREGVRPEGAVERAPSVKRDLGDVVRSMGSQAYPPDLETFEPERQAAIKTNIQSAREQAMGNAAARLAQAKGPKEQAKHYDAFVKAYNMGLPPEGQGQLTNNPQLGLQPSIADSLKSRGVKMSPKRMRQLAKGEVEL